MCENMKNNIFITLERVKPHQDSNPTENYVTESLAFILKTDSRLCDLIVNKIVGPSCYEGPYEIETQVPYRGSIVDLEITDKNKRKLVVESKWDSRATANQLEKYLHLKHIDKVCLVAKEKNDELAKKLKGKKKFIGQFLWKEIYNWIQEPCKHKTDTLKKYTCSSFLEFMEYMKENPFKGFTEEDQNIAKTDFLALQERVLLFLTELFEDEFVKDFRNRHGLSKQNNKKKEATFSRPNHSYSIALLPSGKKALYYIELGFYIPSAPDERDESERPELNYFQGVWVAKNISEDSVNRLRKLANRLTHKSKKWVQDNGFYLLEDSVPFVDLVKPSKKGLSKLRNFITSSLKELETSGFMEGLKGTRK